MLAELEARHRLPESQRRPVVDPPERPRKKKPKAEAADVVRADETDRRALSRQRRAVFPSSETPAADATGLASWH